MATPATTFNDQTHAYGSCWSAGLGEAVYRDVKEGRLAVDARGTYWGGTPLMIAARNNQAEGCAFLVAHGADVTAQNTGPQRTAGYSVLAELKRSGHIEAPLSVLLVMHLRGLSPQEQPVVTDLAAYVKGKASALANGLGSVLNAVAQIQQLQEQSHLMTTENARLSRELAGTVDRLEVANAESARLSRELAETVGRLETASTENARLSQELAETGGRLEAATKEIIRLNDVVRGLQQISPFANAPETPLERDEGKRTGAGPTDPFSVTREAFQAAVEEANTFLEEIRALIARFPAMTEEKPTYSYGMEAGESGLRLVEHRILQSVADLWRYLESHASFAEKWNRMRSHGEHFVMFAPEGFPRLLSAESINIVLGILDAAVTQATSITSIVFINHASDALFRLKQLCVDVMHFFEHRRHHEACATIAAACDSGSVYAQPVAFAMSQLGLAVRTAFVPAVLNDVELAHHATSAATSSNNGGPTDAGASVSAPSAADE